MVNLDAEKNRRDIAKALLRDDAELARLYQNSGLFHHGIKALVGLLPEFVDFLAAKGHLQEQEAEITRARLERGETVPVANKAGVVDFITEVAAAQAMRIRDQVGTPKEHAQQSGHLVTDGRCLDCAWPNLPDDTDAPTPYTGPRIVKDGES